MNKLYIFLRQNKPWSETDVQSLTTQRFLSSQIFKHFSSNQYVMSIYLFT